MSKLTDRLKAYLATLIPTRKLSIYNQRNQPAYLANLMDVDRLHGILRDAEAGNTQELFALYRDVLLGDSHLQGEFGKRKLAVIGDTLSIQPKNKLKPDDVAAAAFINDCGLEDLDGWLLACSHLMDSVLWPVSVLEKRYEATRNGGFVLKDLIPVDYQLLDFRHGTLQIRDTDPSTGNILATCHAPTADRYIVHRGHLLTTSDNWGGPMRSILFWWLLGNMDRDWWARFLDRFGSPFLVGKYDPQDDASRSLLERAFSAAVRIGGLVVSKQTEVEIMQAATQSTGEAFEKFHTIANREKSKLIIGQTLSADAQSTGLGSGVAKGQGDVRQDIRQFDAKMLGHTLRTQLIDQILQINGLKGSAPRLIWGAQSVEETKATGEFIAKLKEAGIELSDAGIQALSEQSGLPLRRSAAVSPVPMSLQAFSVTPAISMAKRGEEAGDQIARAGAAELSQAFRGSLAPVRRLIEESESAADLEGKLKAFYADWSPEKTAAVLERALVAFAANGVK